MKISRNEAVIGLMSVITVAAMSCNKNGNNVAAPPAKEVTLQMSNTLGNYLVDKTNRTLYFFADDPSGQDSCTGGCQAYWPIFNVDNLTADKLGTGLSLSDFGSVTSVSGKKQL